MNINNNINKFTLIVTSNIFSNSHLSHFQHIELKLLNEYSIYQFSKMTYIYEIQIIQLFRFITSVECLIDFTNFSWRRIVKWNVSIFRQIVWFDEAIKQKIEQKSIHSNFSLYIDFVKVFLFFFFVKFKHRIHQTHSLSIDNFSKINTTKNRSSKKKKNASTTKTTDWVNSLIWITTSNRKKSQRTNENSFAAKNFSFFFVFFAASIIF